jgi:UDPglucose 6-dehydrogenase
VGNGVVGSAIARFFGAHERYHLEIYDKYSAQYSVANQRLNNTDLVFVCVPTPPSSDGLSCDTTAVEESIQWLHPPICIRSTIPPGTVDRLVSETGKQIAYSPEYLGEHPDHPWKREGACGFMVVGGEPELCDLIISAYKNGPGAALEFHCTTARTAELCKYMENCFLATKVAFVNQFFDIATSLGVDFEELRKVWLADPRVGPSHSAVSAERGFGGRCLPKDMRALIAVMRRRGGAPLLEALLAYNDDLRSCQR